MKITEVSNIEILKICEGFESKPYKCPAGVWTIGYGTTLYFDTKKRVLRTDKAIDEKEAKRLVIGHIQNVFAPLVDKLCRDDLKQNEFDALVDFTYNTGGGYIDKNGKFQYYDLYKHVNNKMPKDKLIAYWEKCAITGGGKKLNGLIKRRKLEIELFFK